MYRFQPHLVQLEDRLAPGNLFHLPLSVSTVGVPADVGVAAVADPIGCPPTQETVSGDFSVTPVLPILNHPLLQATLAGSAGTFNGQIVFQPIPVPPSFISDGCQENSRFSVTGFVGTLTLTGPAVEALTGSAFGPTFQSSTLQLVFAQPTDASLQVHFGTQPNTPSFTFRSNQPAQVQVLIGGSFVPVGSLQFVQIVGGQVLQLH